MKRLIFLISLLLAGFQCFAQSSFVSDLTASSERGANQFYVKALVDSTGDTLTTAEINLSLNNGIYNIPIFAKKLFTSAAGKPRLKIVRQEYAFGSWRDARTLYTADSLETYQDFTADTLRATRNRYLIMGTAGNRSDTVVEWILRFLKLPY